MFEIKYIEDVEIGIVGGEINTDELFETVRKLAENNPERGSAVYTIGPSRSKLSGRVGIYLWQPPAHLISQ